MYAIYKNVKLLANANNVPPALVNYKVDVMNSLIKKETIDHGRLLGVSYYNDTDESELILKVSIAYNDDTNNPDYPLSRVTTRKWFDNTGICHEIDGYDITRKVKHYNKKQAITEGIVRRTNIVNIIFTTSIQMGYILQAKRWMIENSPAILAYQVVGDETIKEIIINSSESWLDDTISTYDGASMRQIILASLTI